MVINIVMSNLNILIKKLFSKEILQNGLKRVLVIFLSKLANWFLKTNRAQFKTIFFM